MKYKIIMLYWNIKWGWWFIYHVGTCTKSLDLLFI